MKESGISYVSHSFTPWLGCSKVDQLCENCWAENIAWTRFGKARWGADHPRVRTSANYWHQPTIWDRDAANCRLIDGEPWYGGATCETVGEPESRVVRARRDDQVREVPQAEWDALPRWRPRVFGGHMCDWLDDAAPIEWLADFLDVVRLTPNLTWLLLTKRPQNWKARLSAAWNVPGLDPHTLDFISGWIDCGIAPENVWIGASAGTQQGVDERVPLLLSIPARVRFLSCEPLLESVRLDVCAESYCSDGPVGVPFVVNAFSGQTYCPTTVVVEPEARGTANGIQWIVAGCESGSRRRHSDINWFVSLQEQCAAAGVPFYLKQIEENGKVTTDAHIFGRQFHEFPEVP